MTTLTTISSSSQFNKINNYLLIGGSQVLLNPQDEEKILKTFFADVQNTLTQIAQSIWVTGANVAALEAYYEDNYSKGRKVFWDTCKESLGKSESFLRAAKKTWTNFTQEEFELLVSQGAGNTVFHKLAGASEVVKETTLDLARSGYQVGPSLVESIQEELGEISSNSGTKLKGKKKKVVSLEELDENEDEISSDFKRPKQPAPATQPAPEPAPASTPETVPASVPAFPQNPKEKELTALVPAPSVKGSVSYPEAILIFTKIAENYSGVGIRQYSGRLALSQTIAALLGYPTLGKKAISDPGTTLVNELLQIAYADGLMAHFLGLNQCPDYEPFGVHTLANTLDKVQKTALLEGRYDKENPRFVAEKYAHKIAALMSAFWAKGFNLETFAPIEDEEQ